MLKRKKKDSHYKENGIDPVIPNIIFFFPTLCRFELLPAANGVDLSLVLQVYKTQNCHQFLALPGLPKWNLQKKLWLLHVQATTWHTYLLHAC